MDDLSYLQNAVYDVLRDLERYEQSNGERDLQLLIGKVDYLRRILSTLRKQYLVDKKSRSHHQGHNLQVQFFP